MALCESPIKREENDNVNDNTDCIIFKRLSSKDLISVKVLNLSNLGLQKVEHDFSALRHVVEIDLSHNQMGDLPSSFASLHRLCTLNLSYNNFITPPEILYKSFPILKRLDLSHNRLFDFPKSPLCLLMLETLDLSHNQLSCPIKWLVDSPLGSLRSLNLGCNPNCIPTVREENVLGHTHCLVSKVVDLNINNCNMDPKKLVFLKNFASLKSLNLSSSLEFKYSGLSNHIEDIDIHCFASNSLTELNASNIRASSFPDKLEKLKCLEVCDLSYNKLSWLPQNFGTLKNIRILNLSNCDLIDLPESLSEMSNLQELLLPHNDVSTLSDSLLALEKLRVLDLFDNSLEYLPNFSNLKGLTALDLSLNFLDPPETIEINTELRQYQHLRDNLLMHVGELERTSIRKFQESRPSTDDEESSESELSAYAESSSTHRSRTEIENETNECWDSLSQNDLIPLCGYPDDEFYADRVDAPYEVLKSEHFFLPYPGQECVQARLDINFETVDGQFDDC